MQPDDTAHESEMLTVASLFREAVQVTPPSDEVVSMVALPDELLQHIFKQACNDACNVLDPRAAVALSRASHGIRAAAQALLPQLKAYHKAALALCLKLRERRGSTDRALRSCKELREAKQVYWIGRGLTAADLALLRKLVPVLPALQIVWLLETAGTEGAEQLVEGLGAGAPLPVVTYLLVRRGVHVGDAGASALAGALGQGALPRLKRIVLNRTAIGDAGLVALAPALRRLPALEWLGLAGNPFGDEGLRFLVGAPPPVHLGAGCWEHPPWSGVLTKLEKLNLDYTQITDAGCRILEIALNSGALPTLEKLILFGIPARPCMMRAVSEARSALWCTARAQSVERAASASTRRAL